MNSKKRCASGTYTLTDFKLSTGMDLIMKADATSGGLQVAMLHNCHPFLVYLSFL